MARKFSGDLRHLAAKLSSAGFCFAENFSNVAQKWAYGARDEASYACRAGAQLRRAPAQHFIGALGERDA